MPCNSDLLSAESRLEKYNRFSASVGLECISALLAGLGNPQNKLKYVHVAGTNGKGSTTAMIAEALTSAGYKTGMYTSPSVEKLTERVCINMEPVEDLVFASALQRVMDVSDGLGLAPAKFDVLTAAAFLVFAEAECGIVATEVGLGGRFDATNVIPPPEVAVITSISLDHVAQLGSDIAAVAREKCGILKGGCTVVSSAGQVFAAAKAIEDSAKKGGCRLIIPDISLSEIESMTPEKTVFTYRGERYTLEMSGRHFVSNALTAIEALNVLRERGFDISSRDVVCGVKTRPLTGRLQTVLSRPTVMVDGAHNPDGAEKLCAAVKEMFSQKRIITLMGMYSDKDYKTCVGKVAEISGVFFAVEPKGERALPASAIADVAMGKAKELRICPDVKTALSEAMESWQEGDIILCCGSFGLAAEVKKALSGKKEA